MPYELHNHALRLPTKQKLNNTTNNYPKKKSKHQLGTPCLVSASISIQPPPAQR